MYRTDNKLIFQERLCHWCSSGLAPGRKACPVCRGTGCGPKGGKKKCRQCFGNGTVVDYDNPVPCEFCKGKGILKEDVYDYLPREIWEEFEFQVFRINRDLSYAEEKFGIFPFQAENVKSIYSVVDYGRHRSMTDEELITKVRECTYTHQAVKVVDEEMNICSFIAIVTANNGYSVISVWR